MVNKRSSMDDQRQQFDRFIEAISPALEHADRVGPFGAYCMGVMLEGERKSVEPMAARLNPTNLRQTHQSLHHFISTSAWSDQAVLTRVGELAIPVLQEQEPIRAWIVDDTGIPKKGKHSVGVSHQYCGQLGKQANCQVAVSLSVATTFASVPIAYRLYLPQVWIDDTEKRKTCGVPDDLAFATKQQIAVNQIRNAIDAGIPSGVVLADAAYGDDTGFRDDLTDLGMSYAVSIKGTTTVWRPGEEPLLPHQRMGRRGPAATRLAHSAEQRPISASGGTSKPSTQGHFKIGQLVAHRLELSSNHSRLNKGPCLAFSDRHTGLPR